MKLKIISERKNIQFRFENGTKKIKNNLKLVDYSINMKLIILKDVLLIFMIKKSS